MWLPVPTQRIALVEIKRRYDEASPCAHGYFAPFRDYLARTGRWTTRDPAGDVDGPNRYLFVGNNPRQFFDYTPFGTPLEGDDETPFGFHGLWTEDLSPGNPTGPQLMAAMFRDSRGPLARFTSRDPSGFVDGPNRYRWLRNNPFRYRDSNGLWPWDEHNDSAQNWRDVEAAGEALLETGFEALKATAIAGALLNPAGAGAGLTLLALETANIAAAGYLASGLVDSLDDSCAASSGFRDAGKVAAKVAATLLILGGANAAAGSSLLQGGSAGISAGRRGGGDPGQLRPLSRRQASLLDRLGEGGSEAMIPRRHVSMGDLRRLTIETGDEFAMFTRGGRRLIIRGQGGSIPTSVFSASRASQMGQQGWRFSGHTHTVGYQAVASEGDRVILRAFGQRRSGIWGATGAPRAFYADLADEIAARLGFR